MAKPLESPLRSSQKRKWHSSNLPSPQPHPPCLFRSFAGIPSRFSRLPYYLSVASLPALPPILRTRVMMLGPAAPVRVRRILRQWSLFLIDSGGEELCPSQILPPRNGVKSKLNIPYFLESQKKTKAMQAGSVRHAVLEEEVIKRVKVTVESGEDVWALKLVNFIVGVNQLLLDGLTRELPLVGLVEGIWMVGIIDEIRMPVSQSERFPVLVDTKTRQQATLPREPQKRNGRLQLMCYKYMWDSLVIDKFPWHKFYKFFLLNPNRILSQKIRELTEESGFPSGTLSDVVRYFGNSCCLLPEAHNRLLLRYELQEDQSLLGEDEFDYEFEWVKDQIKSRHEFWAGKREAEYPPMDERWKCRFCQFKSVCPATSSSPPSSPTKTKIIDGPHSPH